MLIDLFTGMLIGFLIAVPVGPIDILCIRRTLLWGARSGFITGMGAAFADVIYGGSAAFGMIALTTFLLSYKLPFQFLGGIFLCALGIRNLRSAKKNGVSKELIKDRLVLAFLGSFFLALTSPMTILSFVGAFAALGVSFEGSGFSDASMLTLGVFLGSSAWWLILSYGVALFKNKLNLQNLYWINRLSGIILLTCGLIAIALVFVGFS